MRLIAEITEVGPIEQYSGIVVRSLVLRKYDSYFTPEGQMKTRSELYSVKLFREVATSFSQKVGDMVLLQLQTDVHRYRTAKGEMRIGFELRVESVFYLGTNPNPGNEASVNKQEMQSMPMAPSQMPESIDINGEAGYTRHLL